ncbi:hypothetical protein [uncultured Pseudacidovorax sp.]|uniref:hypothetical protein n=1 Tax=uncultured Pseudacidovorax sp. TaxID=679313 RepID=UPI0025F02F14|nr:hypothetical protein [uncultured Pseudacidovorax sp.]
MTMRQVSPMSPPTLPMTLPDLAERLERPQSGLWVLLWSQSQNALHVEPLERMIAANRAAYTDDRRMDYVPLVIGERAQVDATATACRHTIMDRAERREEARSAATRARAHLGRPGVA